MLVIPGWRTYSSVGRHGGWQCVCENSSLVLAAAILCLSADSAEAAPLPRQISWEDLAPASNEPIEDPLEHMDPYITADLYGIYSAIRQKETGFLSAVSPEYEDAMDAKYRLQKRGVEVEKLMQQLETVEAEARRLEEQMVHSLDGEFVKFQVMLYRIEFDGVAVQEFLWCRMSVLASMPPPPRNQMPVKLPSPFYKKPVRAGADHGPNYGQKHRENPTGLGRKIPVSAGYTIESAFVEPYKG